MRIAVIRVALVLLLGVVVGGVGASLVGAQAQRETRFHACVDARGVLYAASAPGKCADDQRPVAWALGLDGNVARELERTLAEVDAAVAAFDLEAAAMVERDAAFRRDLERLRAQLEAEKSVKGKLDSMSEMGEMESLRLQMAMDRLSKMMSTLSNILKKISETSQGITQNIK